jgi:hypothetical protein
MILSPSKVSLPEKPPLRVGFNMLSAVIIRYDGLAYEFESELGKKDRAPLEHQGNEAAGGGLRTT